jgi:hypothetical protein
MTVSSYQAISQVKTVPFIVLGRAAVDNDTQFKKFLFELIRDTCVQVIHAAPLRVALPLCIYISLSPSFFVSRSYS